MLSGAQKWADKKLYLRHTKQSLLFRAKENAWEVPSTEQKTVS
tara:strand:- start:191 stop:319 length:129 start_codon:yes stop_codon:yes gene_type:complete